MLNNPFFYHTTLRKVLVAFGSIFNDIYITRQVNDVNFQRIKVPINYENKNVYIYKLNSQISPIDPTKVPVVEAVLPSMTFQLTNLNYDPSRKTLTTTQRGIEKTSELYGRQYAGVPYNAEISLSIYSKNETDGFQIIEQIAPFFTPEFNVTVDLIPVIQSQINIPFSFLGMNEEKRSEGPIDQWKFSIWTLNFNAKFYMFGPEKTSGIIKQVDVFFRDVGMTQNFERLTITPLPTGATAGTMTGTHISINTFETSGYTGTTG